MAYTEAEFVKELKGLGVNVSRETMARLEAYAALLVKWQAKINLVGPATLPDLWRRHFLDSAQLIISLPRAGGGSGRGRSSRSAQSVEKTTLTPTLPQLGGGGSSIGEGGGVLVDLGSGGGFPGLVLAMLTDWQVHLIDSDQRKCAFLRQVALETGILDRVTIHTQRFETVTPFRADIVTARACAPLDDLLGHAAPFIGESGRCLFLKGKGVEEELTAAQAHWTMRLERRPSLSEPAATILIVDHLQRRKGQ